VGTTNDGLVKAIFQILYGHYHIWNLFGILCIRPEKPVVKTTKYNFPWTRDSQCKVELIVWPKTPQMPQKIAAQNVCPSQKFGIFEKKFTLGVRSP
jgi:hypothetical protein